MASEKASLRKYQFITFMIIACAAILLYWSKMPWEENIRFLLGYYDDISRCFLIVACVVILFRMYAFIKTGVAAETRKLRFFGPIIDLTFDPLLDAALFYSGLFIISTIFEKRMHGLSLDAFLILLVVAVILMYQGIHNLIRLGRETFYVQRTEKVIPE